MKTVRIAYQAAALAGLALALAVAAWAQSTPSSTSPSSTPPASTPTAQPAPGTAPVGARHSRRPPSATNPPAQANSKDKPAPGTTPVGGDTPATTVNPDKVIEPGSQKVNVKPGSIDDVSAVGNRDIGGRGVGNWYSTDYRDQDGQSSTPRRSRRAPSSSPIRWSPST